MYAKDFKVGKKFKHKLFDDYVVVVELEDGKKCLKQLSGEIDLIT